MPTVLSPPASALSQNKLPADSGRRTDIDIVVVGAGLAGLTAARRLRKAGLSILVLEAKDRIGGRIESVLLPNGVVGDLGAQWIRPDQTHAWNLAAEAKAGLHGTYGQGTKLFVRNGRARNAGSSGLPMGLLGSIDAWRAISALDRHTIGNTTLPERWRSATVHDFIADTAWSARGRDVLDFLFRNDLCLPTDRVGLAHLVQQLATMSGARAALNGGEGEIVTQGAGSLVRSLADDLSDAITTGSPVNAIEQTAKGVRVHHGQGSATAARVVLTIPPQLYAGIEFDPLPPASRSAFWSGHQAGQVIKTLIAYDRPWWRERGRCGTLTGPDEPFPFMCDSGSSENGGLLVALSTAGAAGQLRSAPHLRTPEGFTTWLSAVTGSEVPTPVAIASRDWNADPYQQGGYASVRPNDPWPSEPFAPFGRVHFAGTETAAEWQSYMSGAIQSGERASSEILSATQEAVDRSVN